MLELIVNQNKNVENIALVENGKLVEVYNSDDETKKKKARTKDLCWRSGRYYFWNAGSFYRFWRK